MNLPLSLRIQPEFPLVDLTDPNAEFLELLLANEHVVKKGHELAENFNWVYRVGHPAVMHSAERMLDGTYISAVSHGVAVLEAMSSAVSGTCTADADKFMFNVKAYEMIRDASEGGLRGKSIDTLQGFREQMPRATEVIGSTSQRLFGPLTEYAILGAALERQIIVDSMPTFG